MTSLTARYCTPSKGCGLLGAVREAHPVDITAVAGADADARSRIAEKACFALIDAGRAGIARLVTFGYSIAGDAIVT
jgi:hypothetical protein